MVIQRLDVQTKTLDVAIQRFQSRDANMFQCVVKAIANRDQARANILANELHEIRKVEKMLIQESLAFESVSMRLKTVSEVGDLVTILGPAASVLNDVRSGMSGILPQASQELENIGSLPRRYSDVKQPIVRYAHEHWRLTKCGCISYLRGSRGSCRKKSQ